MARDRRTQRKRSEAAQWLDSLERCSPGLLTHKILRTFLQQYSLRDLPEIVKLTMLMGVTSIHRELNTDGPVSIEDLRKHVSTSHTAVIVGKDISNIEGHLRNMKAEINVFKQELENSGHEDKGDANENDRAPLQNTALTNEEAGDSQVIRPVQLKIVKTEPEPYLAHVDYDIISNRTKDIKTIPEVDKTVASQKIDARMAAEETTSFSGEQPSSQFASKINVRSTKTKRATKPSTFYFKPSSQWRSGTGKDDDIVGDDEDVSSSNQYNDFEISKLIYPSWWFHPGESIRPHRPMSASYVENQPRLAYKGPTREEEREALASQVQSNVLKNDLVTGKYVGVPSSGYGSAQYNVNESNDTNSSNTAAMRDTLRKKDTDTEKKGLKTAKEKRPRFNNILKPIKSASTESKVRQRLLKDHMEAQRKHNERLKTIEKAFYPAKYEAKKSVEAALEKINNQGSVVKEESNQPSSSSIVDSFYSNPILSRFCEGFKDDDDYGAGLQVLGTTGFGMDNVFDNDRRQLNVQEVVVQNEEVIKHEDTRGQEHVVITKDIREDDKAKLNQQQEQRAPQPKKIQKTVRKPWVGDFGHLSEFPRFPKHNNRHQSDPETSSETVSHQPRDVGKGKNVLFDMAFDSKNAREQREQKILFDEDNTLSSVTALTTMNPILADLNDQDIIPSLENTKDTTADTSQPPQAPSILEKIFGMQ